MRVMWLCLIEVCSSDYSVIGAVMALTADIYCGPLREQPTGQLKFRDHMLARLAASH